MKDDRFKIDESFLAKKKKFKIENELTEEISGEVKEDSKQNGFISDGDYDSTEQISDNNSHEDEINDSDDEKVDNNLTDDENSEDNVGEEENSEDNVESEEEEDDDVGNDIELKSTLDNPDEETPILKPLNPKQLKKLQDKIERSGILYVSRVPPFMKPIKLRHLLARFSKNGIGRIYLAAEDSKIALRRKKYRGNKRVNFTEGWVEFFDKSEAKAIAKMLNGQPIGGKKRDRYYDDLWTLKYLPKFKWNNLNEQIAYERAVREHRLRTEMQQAQRENKEYISNVNKSKMVDAITERKKRKAQDSAETKTVERTQSSFATMARNVKQRKIIDSDFSKISSEGQTTKKPFVLNKLF
ncbi:RNA-binding ATPase activator esf2 [Nowakowskiella sp. JEL0078]|nr:RNA-binding ATPase activator esf2 [Nowakowskiella sp. JEL0078]